MIEGLISQGIGAAAGLLQKQPEGARSKLTEAVTTKNSSRASGAKLTIKTKTKNAKGGDDPLGLAGAEQAKAAAIPPTLILVIFALVSVLILAAIIFAR